MYGRSKDNVQEALRDITIVKSIGNTEKRRSAEGSLIVNVMEWGSWTGTNAFSQVLDKP